MAPTGIRLDLRTGQLFRGEDPLPLRRRTWDVLCYLARRPGVLVTKDELLDAVWGRTVVSEVTLSTSIREIRKALDDDAHRPRYLETVHRRGFRFLADLIDGADADGAAAHAVVAPAPPPAAPVFGRDAELDRLAAELERASAGELRIVFVSGEAGIGKSGLLHAFLDRARQRRDRLPVWATVGRCVAQHDGGEAYLAILDALERLVDGIGEETLRPLLATTAPTWLAQLPWLASGATPEAEPAPTAAWQRRMPRELARLLEALAERATLVLALEDLHLSEPATVELLRLLGTRRRPARLLVVATYRIAEAIVDETAVPDLLRHLRGQPGVSEIELGLLAEPAVAAYLDARFGAHVPADLPRRLHAHTDGHPLFLVSVADHLDACGAFAAVPPEGGAAPVALPIPDTLGALLRSRLAMIEPPARAVLDAASVAGIAFDAEAVAAGAGLDVEAVETICTTLVARRLFLRDGPISDWPDGSISAGYAFVHALYRAALYDALTPARRRRLHQRIGERLEAGFAARPEDRAGELARHFLHARDDLRAARHLLASVRKARRRCAEATAVEAADLALAALARAGAGRAGEALELELLLTVAPALIATQGYAAPRLEAVFDRAAALAAALGRPLERLMARTGLAQSALERGDLDAARRRCRTLCRDIRHADLPPPARAGIHAQLVLTLLYRGELIDAEHESDALLAHYDPLAAPRLETAPVRPDAIDPAVLILGIHAVLLGFRGRLADARARIRQCVTRAAPAHPFATAFALTYEGQIHLLARDGPALIAGGEALLALAERHDFVDWKASALLLAGAGHAEVGDLGAALPCLRAAVRGLDEARVVAGTSYFLTLVAEAFLRAGDADIAAAYLDRAARRLAHGERIAATEIERLRVACARANGLGAEPARSRLRAARDLARSQGNAFFAHRAEQSLAALRASD